MINKEGGLWTLLFADHTKMAGKVENNKEIQRLQEILTKIYEWVSKNRMMINADSTEARIGRGQRRNIEFSSTSLWRRRGGQGET